MPAAGLSIAVAVGEQCLVMNVDAPILLIPPSPDQASALAAAIHALAPALELVPWQRELPAATLGRVEVVLGWRLPPALPPQLPALRWVCAMAAGVEKLLVPGLGPQVQLSRVVDPEQALGIAQYVAMVALARLRELPRYQALQLARLWQRHPIAAARPRVGVLGWGEVGREVGRVLQALGFAVRGWKRDSGPLHGFLADCELVVNALPLTPDTVGLLDEAAFEAMSRGAYFVNIARGGHVVEADLIAAVTSGQLGGAALDVQQTEPLPPDDPLWTTPGVTITPHIAAQSSLATVAGQFVDGLRALQAGRPLPHAVDRRRGY